MGSDQAKAIVEAAAKRLHAKFPRRVTAPNQEEDNSPVVAEPLSDKEADAVRLRSSDKPASLSPIEKPVVIIDVDADAETGKMSVPIAGAYVAANTEKETDEGEIFSEQAFRGNRRREKRKVKGMGKKEDAGNSAPLIHKEDPAIEAEQKREAERQSLRDQIQARDVKSREDIKLAVKEVEDPDNEAGFAQRKRDQWSFVEEKKSENDEQPEISLAERLKKAEEEVALARQQFIKGDFNQTSSWNKVKSFFRLTSEDSASGANADVEGYREIYTEKLLLLQDLQFQSIRESGVTGEKLKEAFAGTLRYFKYDEAVRLYEARTDVRRENMTWGDRVAGVFENIGKEYNKLSVTKKLALSAVLIGGSFATGGASLLVKRLLSGAGTFVGAEALLEKLADKKESSQAQKEIAREMGERGLRFSIINDDREDLENRMQRIIEENINALDSKLQKKKRNALLRKGMALGIGVGIGSGALSQLAMERLGGKETLQAAETYVKDYLGEPEIAPETAAPPAPTAVPESMGENLPSAPELGSEQAEKIAPTEQEALIADIQKALEAEGQGTNGTSPATAEYSPEARQALAREVFLEDGGKNFLEDYRLTRADGPRGLWGVLESRLPEGLSEEQQNRTVQKLENVIAERLAAMTPEQQATVGFRSGDINRIYAGETIKFGEVLTAEDIQNIVGAEVLDGEVDTSEGAQERENGGGSDMSATDETDGEAAADVESDGSVAPEDSSEITSDDNPVTADIQYDRDIILGKEYNLQSYKEYFRLNEEVLPFFKASGIEYMNFISQDNPAMMRSIGDKTFVTLDRSTLQGTSLEKFTTLAGQTYGKSLGLPGPKEKVYEYVMRMAMLGVEHPTRERIPLPQLFSV